MSKYTYHIFCCINERHPGDPKGCCKERGSEKILDYLKGAIHDMKLKKEVRATATKCLGACSHGPAVVIYPEGRWYTVPTVEDAHEIIEFHIVKGKPVERLYMKV